MKMEPPEHDWKGLFVIAATATDDAAAQNTDGTEDYAFIQDIPLNYSLLAYTW